jgi:hypothetical protein
MPIMPGGGPPIMPMGMPAKRARFNFLGAPTVPVPADGAASEDAPLESPLLEASAAEPTLELTGRGPPIIIGTDRHRAGRRS